MWLNYYLDSKTSNSKNNNNNNSNINNCGNNSNIGKYKGQLLILAWTVGYVADPRHS